MKCYPVPPVCTLYWSSEDWEKTAVLVVEDEYINALGYKWKADGRNEKGETVYKIVAKL